MSLKKYIPEPIKNILKKIKFQIIKSINIIKLKKYQKKCRKNKVKEVYIFNTPLHRNIGDHAIIFAEYKLLDELRIEAFEIPTFLEKYYFEYLKKHVEKNAVICITGGGFIGSQWLAEENLVNKVINTFKKHKIIIFPATNNYKNDKFGKKELEKSKKILDNVDDLTIFAREEKTFEFISQEYKNAKKYLVPDIVLFLKPQLQEKRKGILLCLRSDVEGNLDIAGKETILNLANKYSNVKITDTVEEYDISIQNREYEINKKIKEFASSELVITDRLHGMIFAAITGTACIVLGNYNYKVIGVYEKWIKEKISNIIFVENVNKIEEALKKIENSPKNKNKIEFEFNELIKTLKEKING